jgi:lysophospholipid acyltransferase (LPLAT)-like uncharacterized protein
MNETPPQKPPRRSFGTWLKHTQRAILSKIGSYLFAACMLLLRWTCRRRFHNDQRAKLKARGFNYVYSVLHAHQIAAATLGHNGTAAMVSPSRDGELIAVGLKALKMIPIRGSSRRNRDNGGLDALNEMIEHVRRGGPAYLAVDGPRGPRNRVHKGIAVLSQRSGAAVINVSVIPSRRWIIGRSWDRIQIPIPFCRIDCFFGIPILPVEGESVEDYRRRIEADLNAMEVVNDPSEARRVIKSTFERRNEQPPNSAAA